jgi:hypothetical protein
MPWLPPFYAPSIRLGFLADTALYVFTPYAAAQKIGLKTSTKRAGEELPQRNNS